MVDLSNSDEVAVGLSQMLRGNRVHCIGHRSLAPMAPVVQFKASSILCTVCPAPSSLQGLLANLAGITLVQALLLDSCQCRGPWDMGPPAVWSAAATVAA